MLNEGVVCAACNPAYMTWNGNMPTPNSMPGSKGLHRTTSGPVADRRVRQHNKMRSLRPSSGRHRQPKTLSPELAALLGRSSKTGKDKETTPRDKEGGRDGQLSARTAGTADSSGKGQVRNPRP